MIITDVFSTNKKYDLIYTDPPWPQKKGNIRRCRPNQGRQLDYPTMSVDGCFKTQDPFFARTSEKHNIFIWTIDKFLLETSVQMEKRGYKLHARFIWDKENGIAPAFTVRFSHEYLLWFYKPNSILMPRRECFGKYTTVMREPASYHSCKPVCAYEMLEDMFCGAERIELFARRQRPGWDCWGNDIGGIDSA
ncbi:DNA methyltransferase [Pseudoflavonifractor sp. 60]|uniref:MT-A70 family methyltransferase n=1 Tax=Pseudoflavonifractor sp. 60 TaxID=2304576 RepID=UPI00136F1BE7|nr:MT-A70 family methyltransferase [Pseudoflavonifractor sp. 60]NBI67186.1 DNA methyltransferase [Pseudoflavonifractor sp. 60]